MTQLSDLSEKDRLAVEGFASFLVLIGGLLAKNSTEKAIQAAKEYNEKTSELT